MAQEERHLDLAFERTDLLAERRLLQSEPLRGTGDVALLGDGDEVAEMTEFHEHIYYICRCYITYI